MKQQTNTIAGRLHLRTIDDVVLALVILYVLAMTAPNLPLWAYLAVCAVITGFVHTLYHRHALRVAVRYDEQGVKVQRRALLGPMKEQQVKWRNVYGLDKLSRQGTVALIGKGGEVLVSVPQSWQGLEAFSAVVRQHLDERGQHAEQLDFYLPGLKVATLWPYFVALLTLLAISFIRAYFAQDSAESLWQSMRFEIIVSLTVTAIMFARGLYRLSSLHINKRALVLKYPLFSRRIRYQDIASAELIEDPSKPVASNVRRLRINLKGRAKHYHVSEFPNQVESIHRRINQRLPSKVTDKVAHSALTENQT